MVGFGGTDRSRIGPVGHFPIAVYLALLERPPTTVRQEYALDWRQYVRKVTGRGSGRADTRMRATPG
jgi:hypothetical protein